MTHASLLNLNRTYLQDLKAFKFMKISSIHSLEKMCKKFDGYDAVEVKQPIYNNYLISHCVYVIGFSQFDLQSTVNIDV